MIRIVYLLLASFMSASVFADSENWSFVQSVGGVAVDSPFLSPGGGWVLPVRADVSGLQSVTTKPTTLNSALVCEQTGFAVDGRNIYITIVTAPTKSTPVVVFENDTPRCPWLAFGEMLPGKYSVFYRGPSEAPVSLGEVYFGEDGPADVAKIAKVIKQADKVVVFEGMWTNSRILFSSTSAKDIADFNDALSVVLSPPPSEPGPACACGPYPDGPTIRLYSGGTELVLIANQNKNPVGDSRWGRHAILIHIDREKWLKWLDARTIPAPLSNQEAYEAASARDKEGAKAR